MQAGSGRKLIFRREKQKSSCSVSHPMMGRGSPWGVPSTEGVSPLEALPEMEPASLSRLIGTSRLRTPGFAKKERLGRAGSA